MKLSELLLLLFFQINSRNVIFITFFFYSICKYFAIFWPQQKKLLKFPISWTFMLKNYVTKHRAWLICAGESPRNQSTIRVKYINNNKKRNKKKQKKKNVELFPVAAVGNDGHSLQRSKKSSNFDCFICDNIAIN